MLIENKALTCDALIKNPKILDLFASADILSTSIDTHTKISVSAFDVDTVKEFALANYYSIISEDRVYNTMVLQLSIPTAYFTAVMDEAFSRLANLHMVEIMRNFNFTCRSIQVKECLLKDREFLVEIKNDKGMILTTDICSISMLNEEDCDDDKIFYYDIEKINHYYAVVDLLYKKSLESKCFTFTLNDGEVVLSTLEMEYKIVLKESTLSGYINSEIDRSSVRGYIDFLESVDYILSSLDGKDMDKKLEDARMKLDSLDSIQVLSLQVGSINYQCAFCDKNGIVGEKSGLLDSIIEDFEGF